MQSNIGGTLAAASLIVLASLATYGQQLSINSTVNTEDTSVNVLESSLPDAPSACTEDASAAPPESAPPVSPGSSRGPAPAGRGGWSEFHAADARLWGMTGLLGASSIANVELSLRCTWQHSCAYVPVPLRRRAALYGIGLPTDAGLSYVTLRMKASRWRFWWLPDALATAANGYVGVHAAHRLR